MANIQMERTPLARSGASAGAAEAARQAVVGTVSDAWFTRGNGPLEALMLFVRIVVLALLFAPFGAFAQSQTPSLQHVVPLHTFSAGQWVEKVSGDFSKPGEPFVFRIHQDAGYITLPHVHPIDEHITVVKGTWSLGMGRRFNQSALELMETGTFGMAPKNMEHFAWSKTETILQVHGIGPFTSTVVEPVYELTDRRRVLADVLCFCQVAPPRRARRTALP